MKKFYHLLVLFFSYLLFCRPVYAGFLDLFKFSKPKEESSTKPLKIYDLNKPEFYHEMNVLLQNAGLTPFSICAPKEIPPWESDVICNNSTIIKNVSFLGDAKQFFDDCRYLQKGNICKACEIFDLMGNKTKSFLTAGTKFYKHPNGFLLVSLLRGCHFINDKRDYAVLFFGVYNTKTKMVAEYFIHLSTGNWSPGWSLKSSLYGKKSAGDLNLHIVPASFAQEINQELNNFSFDDRTIEIIRYNNDLFTLFRVKYNNFLWGELTELFVNNLIKKKYAEMKKYYEHKKFLRVNSSSLNNLSKYLPSFSEKLFTKPELKEAINFISDFLNAEKLSYKIVRYPTGEVAHAEIE